MAKNKPAFKSNNSKNGNANANEQQFKGNNKTSLPVAKKAIRGNSRGQ